MKLKGYAKRWFIYLGLAVLFSTLSYASALGDSVSKGLIALNGFFESNQYEAYASVIDFTFFSVLFISIYLIGVRYGLRQVTKPEKTIAVLLGLLTAFLLVSSGFSIGHLLPYVNWILYFLLFFIVWVALKGVQKKFYRFVLALLIVLLIIALLSGYFENLTAVPEESVTE